MTMSNGGALDRLHGGAGAEVEDQERRKAPSQRARHARRIFSSAHPGDSKGGAERQRRNPGV